MHGRDEVVVISAEEFRRLKGDVTGDALIAAMQASPHRNVSIEPKREPMPVRDISLRRAGCSIRTFCLSYGRPRPEKKVLAFIAAQPLDLSRFDCPSRASQSLYTLEEVEFPGRPR